MGFFINADDRKPVRDRPVIVCDKTKKKFQVCVYTVRGSGSISPMFYCCYISSDDIFTRPAFAVKYWEYVDMAI